MRIQLSRIESAAVAACLIGVFALAACGHSDKQDAAAQAAEPAGETSTAAATTTPHPSEPGVAGPVSFDEANAAYKEKRYDEAVKLFAAYVERKPENRWGHYMLGLAAWKSGDRGRAELAFRDALNLDSTFVKSRYGLVRVLLEDGKTDDALQQVKTAIGIDSTSAEGFRLLGRASVASGDVDGAIMAYRHAIALDGTDGWSLNNLGLVYEGQGRFEEAIGPLARATEVAPQVSAFWNSLGLALERSGRLVQAADAYRTAQAKTSLARVEGMKQDSTIVSVDLKGAAQRFVETLGR